MRCIGVPRLGVTIDHREVRCEQWYVDGGACRLGVGKDLPLSPTPLATSSTLGLARSKDWQVSGAHDIVFLEAKQSMELSQRYQQNSSGAVRPDRTDAFRVYLQVHPDVKDAVLQRMAQFPEYAAWLRDFGRGVLIALD